MIKKIICGFVAAALVFSSAVFADDDDIYVENPSAGEEDTMPDEDYFGDEDDVSGGSALGGGYTTNTKIKIFVNSREVVSEVPPVVSSGRTLVPARAVFEALGADVRWNGDAGIAVCSLGDVTVRIKPGMNYIFVNSKKVNVDVGAAAVSGRILVPLRAVEESLRCTVNWYGASQYIEILK